MNPSISFVGVGRMGANMARRLKDCGYAITAVFDANAAAAQTLATEIGCVAAPDLKSVTALADVIINCATISPDVHVWVQQKCEAKGATSLEACMASSIPQARDGALYLMCGGRPEVFDRAKPILEKLSGSLRYIGGAGQAAQVKALVNMVMNCNTAALAEGLGLGAALGLDLSMLREVLAQTGANSRVLATDGEDMQNREHSCYFSAAHAAKDSGIAHKLAKQAGLVLPVNAATKKQFDHMVTTGLGDLDKSGIAELTFNGRGGEMESK
jgi:3-hydroxyisobutyrate dehydrogenase